MKQQINQNESYNHQSSTIPTHKHTDNLIKNVIIMFENQSDEEIALRALLLIHLNDLIAMFLPILLTNFQENHNNIINFNEINNESNERNERNYWNENISTKIIKFRGIIFPTVSY